MSRTKERIRESTLRYKKSLGQNFIYDEGLLEALVRDASVTKEEDVLEIGPGAGSLTKPLCEAAHRVVSLELDERLIPLLEAFMAGYEHFTLVQGDAMTADLGEITKDLRRPFVVAANIPYYITTPLITRLLGSRLPVSRLALMVQKEVAGKIMSRPGEEGWGPLAVRCQYYCEPYLAREVPAACFTPAPKVDSAFVVLPVRKEPAVRVRNEKDFFRIVGAAFALRRKTMANGLCAALRMEREEARSLMEKAGLDEKVRGEKLTLGELGALADAWTESRGAGETAGGGTPGAEDDVEQGGKDA